MGGGDKPLTATRRAWHTHPLFNLNVGTLINRTNRVERAEKSECIATRRAVIRHLPPRSLFLKKEKF